MHFSEIKALLTTEEKGNISKAADYLGISQPALSKTIKNLEDRLNIKVFTRLSRGVKPTIEGQVYLKCFKKIINDLNKAQKEVAELHSDFSERLRVSTHTIIGSQIIPKVEKDLSEFKEINVDYIFQNSRRGVEQVIHGDVDLAIVADAQDYPDLVKIRLWKEYIGLYSHNGEEKDTIIYNSNMIAAQKLLRKIRPIHQRVINDYSVIQSIIKKNSHFMALLPNKMIQDENNIALINRFNSDIDISLVYRADKIKTKGFLKAVSSFKRHSRG